MDLPRILLFVLGIGLIFYFFKSIITVALLTRYKRDRYARFVLVLAWRIFRLFVPRTRDYDKIDSRISWFFPITIFVLAFSWFFLVLVGFICLYWATDSEGSLFHSILASGSGLTTLGFFSPTNPVGQVILIFEGIFGLFILAYIITFIPGLQSAIQHRNEVVAWIYARTGPICTAPRLLHWFYSTGQSQSFGDNFPNWETWLREVGASHDYIPVLSFTRSFYEKQDWLTGIGVLLDTVNVALTTIETQAYGTRRVTMETGISALAAMIKTANIGGDSELPDTEPILPSHRAFDEMCTMLAAEGATLKPDRDQAWQDFVSLRQQYGPNLVQLARLTISRPPLWLD